MTRGLRRARHSGSGRAKRCSRSSGCRCRGVRRSSGTARRAFRSQACATHYRASFHAMRARADAQLEPLYPGAAEAIDGARAARRRRARHRDRQIAARRARSCSAITDCSSTSSRSRPPTMRPRSPIPAWCSRRCARQASAPADTVVVGDTVYDIAMARAAGAAAIGVTWGYHPGAALAEAGAFAVIDRVRHTRCRRSTNLDTVTHEKLSKFRHSSVDVQCTR